MLYCNFRSLAFLGLLGFLARQLKKGQGYGYWATKRVWGFGFRQVHWTRARASMLRALETALSVAGVGEEPHITERETQEAFRV